MRHGTIDVRDALLRAQRFFNETAGLLSEAIDVTAARKWLDELVTTLVELSLDQDVGDRGARNGTAKQHELRMKLRKQMEPIAVIARLTLRATPEFRAFRMPKQPVRGWVFIAHARVMAEAAAIYRDVFFKHGLPSSFLDDFESAITKLEESVREREDSLLQRTSATHHLALATKQGRAVLAVLDALVRHAAGDNASLLRAWESARPIRRKPVSDATSPAA